MSSVSSDEMIPERIKVGAFAASVHHRADSAASGQTSEPESDPLMELFHCEESFIDTDKFKSKAGTKRPSSRESLNKRPLSSNLEEKTAELSLNPTGSPSAAKSLFPGKKHAQSAKESEDNFEFLQLKTPFSYRAQQTTDTNQDLGVFFQTVSASANNFKAIPEHPSAAGAKDEPFKGAVAKQSPTRDVASELANLTDQIDNFESSLAEYEDMLKNLETSESELESDAL